MRGGRSQKIISNKKQAAAATPLALSTESYPPWHQSHLSCRSNSSFPEHHQTPVRHLIQKHVCEDPHQTIKHGAYPQPSFPESTIKQGCQTPLPNAGNLLQTETSFSRMRKAEVSLNEFSLIQSINTTPVVHDDQAPTKLTVSLPPGNARSAWHCFG